MEGDDTKHTCHLVSFLVEDDVPPTKLQYEEPTPLTHEEALRGLREGADEEIEHALVAWRFWTRTSNSGCPWFLDARHRNSQHFEARQFSVLDTWREFIDECPNTQSLTSYKQRWKTRMRTFEGTLRAQQMTSRFSFRASEGGSVARSHGQDLGLCVGTRRLGVHGDVRRDGQEPPVCPGCSGPTPAR